MPIAKPSNRRVKMTAKLPVRRAPLPCTEAEYDDAINEYSMRMCSDQAFKHSRAGDAHAAYWAANLCVNFAHKLRLL